MKSSTSRVGQGHILALARHPVGQVDHEAVSEVGADQVGVVDVGVEDVLAGLHLGLQLLDDVTFLNQIVGDLDAGDLFEGLGEDFRLVFVSRNGFRDDLDFHALEGLGGLDEPFHFLHLFVPCSESTVETPGRPTSWRRPCPRSQRLRTERTAPRQDLLRTTALFRFPLNLLSIYSPS